MDARVEADVEVDAANSLLVEKQNARDEEME